MERTLNKQGEFDYDLKNDILFFKVKDREYSSSIEMNNLVIDLDEENFIVGFQIFDASDYFQLSKTELTKIKDFKMQGKIDNGLMKIMLSFGLRVRNRPVEYRPIISERINSSIPNSEMACVVN